MDETGITEDWSNDEVKSTGQRTNCIKGHLKLLAALVGANHRYSWCWPIIERSKTMDDQPITRNDFNSLNNDFSPHMRYRCWRSIDENDDCMLLKSITGNRRNLNVVVSFAHVIQAGWINGAIGNVKARYRENIDSRSTNLDPGAIGFDQLSNNETSDISCAIRFRQIAFHNPPIAWSPQCFVNGKLSNQLSRRSSIRLNRRIRENSRIGSNCGICWSCRNRSIR